MLNFVENKQNKKLLNIEFMRFVLVLCVVVYHLFTGWLPVVCPDVALFKHIHDITRESVRAVDFFFIISGFFLVYTFDKDLSVIDFIKKKIIRLWPVAVFSIVAWFVIFALGFISADKFGTYDNIFGLFLINNIGITTNIGINIQSWYISSLIFVLLFYFYLLKYFEKHTVNLIISIITLFCYSFIIHAQNGSLTGEIITYYNVFNVGIMRALSGCGLGYIIGLIVMQSDFSKNNKLSKFVACLVEIFCICFLLYNMLFNKLNYSNDMLYILIFSILFVIFIKKMGLVSNLVNNNLLAYLGKFSYSIYMVHRIVFAILSATLWKTLLVIENSEFVIFLSILISIFIGIIVYYAVELPFRKILKKLLFS